MHVLKLKKQAPAIIFIDETETLQYVDTGFLEDWLNGLMLLFEENPSKPVIIFYSGRNQLFQQLEDKKQGHLVTEFFFDYPSYEHKKEFLYQQCKKLDLNRKKEFNLDQLTQKFEEFSPPLSYLDMEWLLHDAMKQTAKQNISFSQEFFELYLDKSIALQNRNIKHHQSL